MDEYKRKVIVKFLQWYEDLTPEERYIFEGEMGRLIKNLK